MLLVRYCFNVDLTAFVDELLHEVGVAAPGDDGVPFGVFAGFSVAVTEAFGRGQAEGGYFGVALGALGVGGIKVTDFRVVSNVTDEHYFIQ